MDFHCREFFTSTHVNFTRVNNIEALYKVSNEKATFTFACDLSHIASILFTYAKFTCVRKKNHVTVEIHSKRELDLVHI